MDEIPPEVPNRRESVFIVPDEVTYKHLYEIKPYFRTIRLFNRPFPKSLAKAKRAKMLCNEFLYESCRIRVRSSSRKKNDRQPENVPLQRQISACQRITSTFNTSASIQTLASLLVFRQNGKECLLMRIFRSRRFQETRKTS